MNSVLREIETVVTYAVRQIPIERIRAFDFQPRKWFDPEETTARAESMKLLGQQDPVTVEPVTGDPDHDYELINGESRLRSAREAGIKTLWAAVRSTPYDSKLEKHMASLVANFNRSDHTPMEISDALYVQSTEGGKTQAEISRAIGKCQVWVGRYISLQKLHPDLQAMMHPSRPKSERLATNTAFELARLPHEKQLEILSAASGVMARSKLRVLMSGKPKTEKSTSPIEYSQKQDWTPEREERYRALHTPNPEHVAKLRAGIAEFRNLLNRR